QIVPGGATQYGKSRLVASLHVGSSCWYNVDEANKHPEVMAMLKEKLKIHLLRQLYQDQRNEIAKAANDFMQGWTPMPRAKFGTEEHPFAIRDRLVSLAKYAPPPGYGEDDGSDCDRGPNCGCEQFEF